MASFLDVLLLIAVGRIFIYLWMQFPMPQWFEDSKFGKLHHCLLCCGAWIYSTIFLLFGVDLLSMMGLNSSWIIGGTLSGGVISYIMFLLELGFNERFRSFIIE